MLSKKTKKQVSALSINSTTLVPRDLSWLAFNDRVLQEASSKQQSPNQRLKFLAIYSNNLDEFYRVRIGALHKISNALSQNQIEIKAETKLILEAVQQKVADLDLRFKQLYAEITKDLKLHGIEIKSHEQLTKAQIKYIQQYYIEHVNRHITPLMVESLPVAPNLEDGAMYLAINLMHSSNSLMQSYALIKLPVAQCGRFFTLPSTNNKKQIVLLESMVKLCLPFLFQQFGFDTFEAHVIKIIRDSELNVEHDDNTLLIPQLISALNKRKKGKAVRFCYDQGLSPKFLKYLLSIAMIPKSATIMEETGIHNFKDFINFPVYDSKPKTRNWQIKNVHKLLQQPCRIFDVVQKQDILLAPPYHSFESVIDLLREASIDPTVHTIWITIYRLNKDSAVASALINAARNGKRVVVVLELKARFDEQANLSWQRAFEEEGIEVHVGKPRFKVHAKLILIERQIGSKEMQYCMISTGNMNENTSKTYSDLSVISAKPEYTSAVKKIFLMLSNVKLSGTKINFNNGDVLTSPHHTHTTFIKLLEREAKHSKAGKKAHCIIKLNSLSEPEMIAQIEKAAMSGVKIDLIVRGIFCLKLDYSKAWHKNIRCISIIDSFLEHARCLYFYNNGKYEVYISSADWMTRNLHHRVEATMRINDPKIKADLLKMLQIQLRDNTKARILDAKLENQFVTKLPKQKSIRSQVELMAYFNQK